MALSNTSKHAEPQADCPLFRLAPELRNQIYEFVFSSNTNERGNIEFAKDTKPPRKDLILTCQKIYNESRNMYRAAYQDYPNHTFSINMPSHDDWPVVSALGDNILSRITKLRVDWRADDRNDGFPLRITTHFSKVHNKWDARVVLHDEYHRGEEAAKRVRRYFEQSGKVAIKSFDSYCNDHGIEPDLALAYVVSTAVLWRRDNVIL